MRELGRKAREQAQHRALILEAAEAVFARKGFHSATVQEIAAKAEFSVGYLYGLFEGKTDIYVELVNMRAAQFIADVEERIRRAEGVMEKVRAAIAAKVDFFGRNRQFFFIFVRLRPTDTTEGPSVLPEAARRLYRGYLRRLAAVFAEGIKDGVFAEANPSVLALCLEGMTNGAIAQWVASGGRDAGIPASEALERVFFHGILAQPKKGR